MAALAFAGEQKGHDMLKRLRRNEDSEGGFTLIELLIVIVILGILAAIVVFAVGGTRKDSVSAACKTNVKAVQLSIEAQNTKNGSYPASAADATDQSKGALLKSVPSTADYNITYPSTANGAVSGQFTVGGPKVTGGEVTPTTPDNAASGTSVASVCNGT